MFHVFWNLHIISYNIIPKGLRFYSLKLYNEWNIYYSSSIIVKPFEKVSKILKRYLTISRLITKLNSRFLAEVQPVLLLGIILLCTALKRNDYIPALFINDAKMGYIIIWKLRKSIWESSKTILCRWKS